ncbi:MAG: nucleotidyl transferase AbiEii/AbiGii toxin family protein, partial [Bacteroidota bacterium]
MSYNISSEGFDNPLLKELLENLTAFFASIGSEFYIIGATARDIIISGIHNQQPGRMTDDLDIAIAIPDWNKYAEIADKLVQVEGFIKSKEQKQRFWFKNVFMLDIVPFGEIARADNNIYWPPEETHAMSVAGFSEVAKHTLEIIVDNSFTIYVANLPGIFLLKLAAWSDRHLATNKDADDMAFIISNYLEINIERAVTEHYDIYEVEGFSVYIAGASLLGRDMKEILKTNPEILDEF